MDLMSSVSSFFKRYTLTSIFYLAFCKVFTFLFFRNARLVRLPIDIRGREYISVGKGFTTGKYCRIEIILNKKDKKHKKLFIGANVQINDSVHIACADKIVIEDNVLIASKVFISDHNHGNYGSDIHDHESPDSVPIERPIYSKPVIIKRNVWIGEFVSILPGVTIGEGTVIGSMSVVTKSIPANSIALGIPAKVIKSYNFNIGKWEKV